MTVVAYEIEVAGFWPPVLSAAAGASAAKMIMYYLGVGLRRPLRRNRNVRFLARYANSVWAYLLAFIAAVIPAIPLDDFVYLIGGASGLRARLMALAVAGGKVLKTIAEVTAVYYIALLVHRLTGAPQIYTYIFFAVGGAVAGVVTLLLDWESVARRLGLLREEGPRR